MAANNQASTEVTVNDRWLVSQTVPYAGQINIAFFMGGGLQAAAPILNHVSGIQYQLVIVSDVEGEIHKLPLPSQGFLRLAPSAVTSIGKLIKGLGEASQPNEGQIVSANLKGRHSDRQRGMGQIPSLSHEAMEQSMHEFRRALEEALVQLKLMAGNTIENCTVHVFFGTGGGFGRGSAVRMLDEFRDVYAQYCPEASMTIRLFMMDGRAWAGCGPRVEKNAATAAAALMYKIKRQMPGSREGENYGFYLSTLPPVKRNRTLRNLYVKQTVAMLLAKAFHEDTEATMSNDAMNLLIGNVYITRMAHYGQLDPSVVFASVASAYHTPLANLIADAPGGLPMATAFRQLYATGTTSLSPARSVDEVYEDLVSLRDQNVRFVAELIGEGAYSAMATAYVQVLTGNMIHSALDLIKVDYSSTSSIKQFLANYPKWEGLLNVALENALRKSKIAKGKALKANKKAKAHIRFHFGTFPDWVATFWPNKWLIAPRGKTRRQKAILAAATAARISNENHTKAEAELEVLKTLRSLLSSEHTSLLGKIRTAVDSLKEISERAAALKGINVKPLDENLPAVLWASGMGEPDKWLLPVLETSVTSVSLDVMAGILGHSDTRTRVSPQMLARLLTEAKPEWLGTEFGDLNRSTRHRDEYFFLPIHPDDMTAVAHELAELENDATLIQVKCGAGVFIGAALVLRDLGYDDINTPANLSLLDLMAKDDADFAKSMIPGDRIFPDPRKKSKKRG